MRICCVRCTYIPSCTVHTDTPCWSIWMRRYIFPSTTDISNFLHCNKWFYENTIAFRTHAKKGGLYRYIIAVPAVPQVARTINAAYAVHQPSIPYRCSSLSKTPRKKIKKKWARSIHSTEFSSLTVSYNKSASLISAYTMDRWNSCFAIEIEERTTQSYFCILFRCAA